MSNILNAYKKVEEAENAVCDFYCKKHPKRQSASVTESWQENENDDYIRFNVNYKSAGCGCCWEDDVLIFTELELESMTRQTKP